MKKIKVALMSYAVDGRKAKGTALYAKKVIEGIIDDPRFEFYLVHYEKSDEAIYSNGQEILMPKVKLPYASHFVSQLLFFWKYRKNKFDIIHWFQPRVYPFFWLAPAKKIIVTTHGAGDKTAPGNWIFSRKVFNFVLTAFHSKVDAFVAVSEYGRKEIYDNYHAEMDHIYFTYNGGGENFHQINKNEAKERVKEKYGIDSPFILNIARHIPHKNILNLINAYKILGDKYEREENLVIVGKRGSESEKIFELVKNYDLSNRVNFIEYIEEGDLNLLYSASDLFIFPSLQEGFGIPIIEAMSCGTPVITSNLSSMPEIAGDAAILVDPKNPAEIAQKINDLLTNDQLKNELIEKGLKRSKEFSWEKTAEKTKEIYLELFNQIK